MSFNNLEWDVQLNKHDFLLKTLVRVLFAYIVYSDIPYVVKAREMYVCKNNETIKFKVSGNGAIRKKSPHQNRCGKN